ncbi:hypothetical protein T11_12469 [Trichinella zimbabwensis]|uniref:Uncharacterized protein n=1 Tax=Trichinella zimbabwensis TaxID=268475 RepID=A0A0V1HZD3_9BILA|nr:hypothetical protein T11_12469 [Trichinella zimbabwensis]
MRLQIWLSSSTGTSEPLHSSTPPCSSLSVDLLRQSCLKTVKGSRSVGALKMRSRNSERTSSGIPLKTKGRLLKIPSVPKKTPGVSNAQACSYTGRGRCPRRHKRDPRFCPSKLTAVEQQASWIPRAGDVVSKQPCFRRSTGEQWKQIYDQP